MAKVDDHRVLKQISHALRLDKPPAGPIVNWPLGKPAVLQMDPTILNSAQSSAFADLANQFPDLAVGIIQFDTNLKPTLLGWQQDLECVLGSMGKLTILYAAFQLREDVRTALKQPGVTPGNIDVKLRQMWSASGVPGLPVTAGSAPHLDRIFDIRPDSVEFQGFAGCGIPPDFTLPPDDDMINLASVHEMEHHIRDSRLKTMNRWAALLDLSFAQQLWLTSRWSDNAAGTVCAADIGMPYIFALMTQSGLYSATDAGEGLRLLRAYEDPPHWNEFSRVIKKPENVTPADWSAKLAGYRKFIQPFADQDFRFQPELTRIGFGGPSQGGTVISLASLMASLVQCSLFQPPSDDPDHPARQMASFLRLTGRIGGGLGGSAGSYIVKALHTRVSVEYTDVWSKLGIDNDTFVDWAYMDDGSNKVGIIVLNYKSTHKDAKGHFFSPFDEVSDSFIDCVLAIDNFL